MCVFLQLYENLGLGTSTSIMITCFAHPCVLDYINRKLLWEIGETYCIFKKAYYFLFGIMRTDESCTIWALTFIKKVNWVTFDFLLWILITQTEQTFLAAVLFLFKWKKESVIVSSPGEIEEMCFWICRLTPWSAVGCLPSFWLCWCTVTCTETSILISVAIPLLRDPDQVRM